MIEEKKSKVFTTTTSSSPAYELNFDSSSATTVNFHNPDYSYRFRGRLVGRGSLRELEGAVYSHIKAMRSLGRISINTVEIASALNVPVRDVNKVIASLRNKGVRPAQP